MGLFARLLLGSLFYGLFVFGLLVCSWFLPRYLGCLMVVLRFVLCACLLVFCGVGLLFLRVVSLFAFDFCGVFRVFGLGVCWFLILYVVCCLMIVVSCGFACVLFVIVWFVYLLVVWLY